MKTRIFLALILIGLFPGLSVADMRGKTICGVPPNEAVVVMVEAYPGAWESWSPYGPPIGANSSERRAIAALEEYSDLLNYVCDVTINYPDAGQRFETRPVRARFFRLGVDLSDTQGYDARFIILSVD